MAKFLDYHGLSKLVEKIKNTYVNKNEQYEANLKWGGGNFADSFGPIDGAMIPELGANRFAFGNPKGITIEYSNDGGNTWLDYGASDDEKLMLTSVSGTGFTIGKVKSSTPANDMLRITFDTSWDKGIKCYTILNKICIKLETGGSDGCYCTIQVAKAKSPTIFMNQATKIPIHGWTGYNIINPGIIPTAADSTQGDNYLKIRFLFGNTGNTTNYGGLKVYNIFAFGGVGWNNPSNMARNGHLYDYDNNQNAVFPSNVTATNFIGTLQGNASSASKLGTATVGSTSTPIYLNSGTPTTCTHSLNADVPKGAVFTDNKVYQELDSSTETPIALLMSPLGEDSKFGVEKQTTNAKINFSITAIPKIGTIKATNFDGKINNHTVNSNVPANAKFTDTTYDNATTSTAGLMSAADKRKLNSAATLEVNTFKQLIDSNTYLLPSTLEAFNTLAVPFTEVLALYNKLTPIVYTGEDISSNGCNSYTDNSMKIVLKGDIKEIFSTYKDTGTYPTPTSFKIGSNLFTLIGANNSENRPVYEGKFFDAMQYYYDYIAYVASEVSGTGEEIVSLNFIPKDTAVSNGAYDSPTPLKELCKLANDWEA